MLLTLPPRILLRDRFKLFHLSLALFCLFLNGCDGSTKEENVKSSPSQASDPAELIKSAVNKQETGAYDEAINILNQALEINAQFAPANYQKGLIYEEWDKREEALKEYKKAIEIDPAYDDARLGLASVYGKSVLNDLAVEQLLKVAETRKDDPEIHFKIALEYWYLQDIPKSANHYARVIEIAPEHLQAHLNLISVYERMKNWGKAIEEIETVKWLAGETQNQPAMSIAERKLKFIKGRMNLTEEEMKRKTEPPFD